MDPLHMAVQKQGSQLEPTYNSSLKIQDVALRGLPEAMNDRERWRERVRDVRADSTRRWEYVCQSV